MYYKHYEENITILTIIWLLIGVVGLIIVVFFSTKLILKFKPLKRVELLALICSILMLCISYALDKDEAFFRISGKDRYITTFIYILNNLIEIVSIIIIGSIIFIVFARFKTFPKEVLNPLKPDLDSFFKDEDFFKALRTVLPTGQSDKEHGLDYIPYMLNTLDEKRKRFKLDAQKFLNFTIIGGLFFTFIVISSAYLLFDDSSSPLNSNTNDLKYELAKTNENMHLFTNKDVNAILEENHINLSEFSQKIKIDTKTDSTINSYITQFEKNKDLNVLKNRLEEQKVNLYSNSNFTQDKNEKFNELISDIEKVLNSKQFVETQFINSVAKINQTVPLLNKALQDSQRKFDEFLKRIALGLIICTFLLAILRYVAKLYQANFQQMIKTENEDLLIRKFYVALKNTNNDIDGRKVVIEKFMHEISDLSDNKNNSGLSQDESNILKETVSVILKKIG